MVRIERVVKLRIHGDNILECERALHLISKALQMKPKYLIESPIYAPEYGLTRDNMDFNYKIQLFPGYNRWGIEIQNSLHDFGAPIREYTDVIVTRLDDEGKEEVVFCMEFCNALPAGNNAWQRTGRALASASLNIPYMQLSEIGGVELDGNRKLKAHRFPNPIIPFSYITLGRNYSSIIVPVYIPSPSIQKEVREKFKEAFGINELVILIRNLILGEDSKNIIDVLTKKSLVLINLLASARKRRDTLRDNDWEEFLKIKSNDKRLIWLENKKMRWSKKSSNKVPTTKTFKELIDLIRKCGGLSVGGGDIPICLIPSKIRPNMAKDMESIYSKKMNVDFIRWIGQNNRPLVIVWVTGFKPRGDDSRPDRGLVPLARMLLGSDVDLLSIVYGPAKKRTWEILDKSPKSLASQNGLWEAIINLSDSVLVDSVTLNRPPILILNSKNKPLIKSKIKFNPAILSSLFSEQDVDSAIHFIFTHAPFEDIFESMCNPPGGDWSGLSFLDFKTKIEYRWTSLPRVSKTNGKRPDHVIELKLPNGTILLSIESKDSSSDFTEEIGDQLNRYTRDLIESVPTVKRGTSDWSLLEENWRPNHEITYLSGGAFCYRKPQELDLILAKTKLDLVMAFDFDKKTGKTILHIKTKFENPLLNKLKLIEKTLNGRLEVKIH